MIDITVKKENVLNALLTIASADENIGTRELMGKILERLFPEAFEEEKKRGSVMSVKSCSVDGNCAFKTLGRGYFGCKYDKFCAYQLPRDSREEEIIRCNACNSLLKPEKPIEEEKKESELRNMRRIEHSCYQSCSHCSRENLCNHNDQQIIDLAKKKVDIGGCADEIKQKLEKM